VAIEIGSTIEGTIVKLADYGAIVRLAGGKVGLVHISEVADAYVRDVRDYFHEDDRVCVKVLKLNNKGRYELSVKQADASAVTQPPQRPPAQVRLPDVQDRAYQPVRRQDDRPQNFEDRLSRFMKDSEERQIDLRRSIDSKRGGGRRK
jgi:S1 RNA binding domain protein